MRIPIYYTLLPGPVPDLDRRPVMDFSVGWGKKGFRGKALVDTGADLIAVDRDALTQTGCPQLEKNTVIKTVHLTQEHPMFHADLRFEEAKIRTVIDVVGVDLGGRAYQAVFGTKLLELGKLVLDIEGESYFEFYPSSLSNSSETSE